MYSSYNETSAWRLVEQNLPTLRPGLSCQVPAFLYGRFTQGINAYSRIFIYVFHWREMEEIPPHHEILSQ